MSSKNRTKQKILITTNHVAHYGGSEIVALEIAEAFARRGFEPTIYANYISAPLVDDVRQSGVSLMTGEPYPDPLAFDIVWSQHHVLPLLLTGRLANGMRKPYFAYAHLSPFEPFELPGVFSERRLADRCYVNSEETRQKMLSFGLGESILTNFHNAAPEKFFAVHKKPEAQLQRILVVSNHLPPELGELIGNGLDGVTFVHIGRGGAYMRVTPEMIGNADAIITIGKTVQYAIAASRPVFCYDIFGGPGWITRETCDKAADRNYSGRCTSRKLSAREIGNKLKAGFKAAYNDVDRIRELKQADYILERYVDEIIEAASSEDRPMIDFADSTFDELLLAESNIAALIRREYAEKQYCLRAHEAVERERKRIRSKLGNGTRTAVLRHEELLELYAAQSELCDATQQRLNEVLNSSSWKLSAPIRKIVSALRR